MSKRSFETPTVDGSTGKVVAEGIDPAESGREATDDELASAGLIGNAPPANDHPAHPSIEAARDMIAAGATTEYAAGWLLRNCPEVFADVDEAVAAL